MCVPQIWSRTCSEFILLTHVSKEYRNNRGRRVGFWLVKLLFFLQRVKITAGYDMSGKIESKQDSQRSHLSSFTMKLMDKFHSPKVKRTPSKKGKQLQVEPVVKNQEKPVNKKVSRLEEQEKEVVSALRYFKTIVDKMVVEKKVLEMLPGSASKVLEAILPLVQVEARITHSSAVSSCHNRVYQSLANLIRWSDHVMLDGIDLDDKDNVVTVTTVIKAVLDGVKELVKLTIEKQEQPSPTTPNKPPPPPVTTPESRSELPLTEREREILSKTPPTEAVTDMAEEDIAPPKPPLPGLKMDALSLPPALPPKKRQSASSPTRVAVVAPMNRGSSLPCSVHRQQQDYEQEFLQRRFSGGSQSYGCDSPRLSPYSSMGKLSRSEEQLCSMEQDSGQCSRNTSCETLDNTESYDPDYDFLHQDLAVFMGDTHLPSTATPSGVMSLSPLPESHSECSSPVPPHPRFRSPPAPHHQQPHPPQSEYWTPQPGSHIIPLQPSRISAPPALPQKKRRSSQVSPYQDGCGSSGGPLNERSPSQYNNLSEEELLHPTPPFPLFTPNSPMPQSNGGVFVAQYLASENADLPSSPPPLPEKRNKHVLAYMQFVEDYSEPQPSVFYQTPQNESIYEQRNKRFQDVYGLNDSFSSTDSVHEPLPIPLFPPPALPPKQRQLSADEGGEGEYVNLYSSSQANGELELPPCLRPIAADDVIQDPAPQMHSSNSKKALDKDSRRQKSTDSVQSDEEEVDELSLIDHKEIMSRITLKQENDDGPDVRAGSRDILLVHATETDRKDLVLYCEVFLTTYRTFISPEDLIKKLHYRYTRFCHSPDTFKKRVSKNTFFVLVRLVDELCLVELTEDILKQLMDLVFRLVCNGELSLARVLRKNILDKVEQKKLLRCTNSLKPLAARGVSARPGTLHDFRSHEIADQLTLLDAELFYNIEIPEVLLWAKEQNEEKSPNLTQFTEHFNNMSYWVRSLIIQQEKGQDREKLLLKFIKIMKHLRKLNNFNSYLAILSALDSAPIRRLEWQKQTSEGLEEYCTLIDSSSSFRAYRAALADVEPPCIPYLGLILQDLTFVHLGNPDLIDGKVNFSKRWQQFNILDSMRRFQQMHYELKRNDDIVCFFNDFSDHLAEEALWELSLKIKPRNITRRRTEREEKT
ncbi:rap guanine nucleotide exchange factor 1b isoform X1 [Salmo salar]|uniref:CRK SH3-binding GNRP n=1 Tax=Salmo salar TaxID=8030 RepID=A0A1S3M2T6_SALSA|nr:rap guanine nucleotide exchange factor 1b isoform X1 [Salmo salar]|eukprot:XP_013997184.1 PREDICTED: rap guanine nucleotide exchange factor 1-like isoform X7 [Salmo salar]